MKNLNNIKICELSKEDLQLVNGGIMFGVALCLFAIGMAIGAGIGSRYKAR